MTAKKQIIEIPYATLNTFLSVLASCSPDARVHALKNKIFTSEVDVSNVYMVTVESECNVTGSPFIFGIDVALMRKVIKHAKGCNVIIEVAGEKIKVKYGRFSSKIDAVEEPMLKKDPNPPEIYLPLSFDVPGKYLFDALSMVTKKGRSTVCAKNGIVSICVDGEGMCVRELIGETENKESFKSIFSNDYMSEIVGTVKDTSVKIDIGIDHPMRAYAEKNDCKITFLLAPRIEAD